MELNLTIFAIYTSIQNHIPSLNVCKKKLLTKVFKLIIEFHPKMNLTRTSQRDRPSRHSKIRPTTDPIQ